MSLAPALLAASMALRVPSRLSERYASHPPEGVIAAAA
jgi:hypothetical protein